MWNDDAEMTGLAGAFLAETSTYDRPCRCQERILLIELLAFLTVLAWIIERINI